MRLDELDYELPQGLIADRPSEPRDACRLMVIHRDSGRIEHRRFLELGMFLMKGDLLVLNSARVLPSRIFARLERGGEKQFEVLLVDPGNNPRCLALIQPARKIHPGTRLASARAQYGIRVVERLEEGRFHVELENVSWKELLKAEGHVPLPPYILKQRSSKSDCAEDRTWYQTAYADRDGAVAAPTAGLHFSERMLGHLAEQGIGFAKIFLKVGIGTFQKIHASSLEEHALLPEEYDISEKSAVHIRSARERSGRVVAVGTTVVRTLEYAIQRDGAIFPHRGSTDLLIAPPYCFRAIDVLVTNFHLPKTTLLALVYAFGGTDLIREAYREAVRERYRFFSYGDAMLIL